MLTVLSSRRAPEHFEILTPFLRISCIFCLCACAFAQDTLPYLTANRDSVFTQPDLDQMYLEQQARDAAVATVVSIPKEELGNSRSVSVLDLIVPRKAVWQFQRGVMALKEQNAKDAIRYLQKAVEIYPNYVSAHNALGIAFLDQHLDDRAKEEFQTAAKLDDRVPLPFMNLGILALWTNDFSAAESNLDKAAALKSSEPAVLAALAYAQNGNHHYADALRTTAQVHRLNHRGQATVHYVAADAARSLHDWTTMQNELRTFLAEDPANPLAPAAHKYLSLLANPPSHPAYSGPTGIELIASGSISEVLTFPDSARLQSELKAVNDSSTCCDDYLDATPSSPAPFRQVGQKRPPTFTTWNKVFTIHQAVDETTVFFAVTEGRHTVNDLSVSDIQVRDDNRPPDRIEQFTSESQLPLHLGLLIDTSSSVAPRMVFEKLAAERFLGKILNSESDLAFVAGFSSGVVVSQDFTSDPAALAKGIQNLPHIEDATSLFDAIYYACWKLAAYPDEGRVAKVLVILTDGEDNSSTRSLQQSIDEAEASGVTVYTINTSESLLFPTEANKILQTLAERTGGESVAPPTLKAFDHYLSRLPNIIRSRYLIAYRPADFAPDGTYRTIRVYATKNGKHLKVHARRGYYARSEPTGLRSPQGKTD